MHTMKLFCMATGLLLSGAGISTAQEIKRGPFTTSFSERSPLHTIEGHAARFGNNPAKYSRSIEYDITKETFEVYVPKDYEPGVPHGLFVWINSVDDGKVPGEWHAVFDKHKMIAVGANKIGNDRYVWCRTGLSVDAVHNLKKLYTIDEERVYLGGLSGGSHCACDGAIQYSDVFHSGFYICAAHPMAPFKHWVVDTAKKRSRFVFCTGTNDNLRDSVIRTHKDYTQSGYAHTILFDIPGMGHTTPNAEWFENGIVFLDSPLVVAAPALYASAQKLEKSGKLRGALEAYLKASSQGRTLEFAAAARAKAAELRPRIETESQEAFGKLQASKPSAQKLRDSAKEWSGYGGGKSAFQEAGALGEKDLEKIREKKGTALRSELQKFIGLWEGYPVAARALEALDGEARPEYEDLQKAAPAKTRHAKLLSFARTWAPGTLAAQAKALVEDEAGKELEEIKKLPTDPEKIPKLAVFAKAYEGTAPGEEAKALLEKLLSAGKKKG